MEEIRSWLGQAVTWLDARGRPAWIVAVILGFVLFWPVGLVLLGYMIWSKRMCPMSKRKTLFTRRPAFGSSGNAAFDAYRDETLRRLEEEQTAFGSFMERLRKAKDQAEFDRFMDERRGKTGPADAEPST